MNILVTGARGFIGKNLCAALCCIRDGKDASSGLPAELKVLEYDLDTDPVLLDAYCQSADFVFHLAGVNRPKEPGEFMSGNFGFTSVLLDTLKRHGNKAPVMLSSSVQAALDNPYGQSKKAGEELLAAYSGETGAPVYIYRFPNVFGKWCRPQYNSAVATFCHNIAHGLPVQVNDRSTRLTLAYIDDVVAELLAALRGSPHRDGAYCSIPLTHSATLGQIVDLLDAFHASRSAEGEARLSVPDMADPFTKKLYAAYLSYLPADGFAYGLTTHSDARGSFTEILRTPDRGQFSVNRIRPGIVKGNHWHHTKNEKFAVVSGDGLIRLRQVGTDAEGKRYPVLAYPVSGERMQIVDIPVGYTHSIENLGDSDMTVFMWCNERFDPEKPDTYFEEV